MMQGSLASRLRLLRVQRGLTLQEASDEIGIDRHTLSSIERGTQTPHAPTLKKIAEGYGVAIENLLVQDDLAEKPVEAPTSPKVEAPTSYKPPEEAEKSKERREELLEEERGAYEEQRHTAVEVEEAGLTDTELLQKLVSPATSEADAAWKKKRFLQYNRVMIVISALEELVDLVELVLKKNVFGLEEIESFEGAITGQYFNHKRYARGDVLKLGTVEQKAALEYQEARMEKALNALQAYLELLERTQIGEDELAERRKAREERRRNQEEQLQREMRELSTETGA